MPNRSRFRGSFLIDLSDVSVLNNIILVYLFGCRLVMIKPFDPLSDQYMACKLDMTVCGL